MSTKIIRITPGGVLATKYAMRKTADWHKTIGGQTAIGAGVGGLGAYIISRLSGRKKKSIADAILGALAGGAAGYGYGKWTEQEPPILPPDEIRREKKLADAAREMIAAQEGAIPWLGDAVNKLKEGHGIGPSLWRGFTSPWAYLGGTAAGIAGEKAVLRRVAPASFQSWLHENSLNKNLMDDAIKTWSEMTKGKNLNSMMLSEKLRILKEIAEKNPRQAFAIMSDPALMGKGGKQVRDAFEKSLRRGQSSLLSGARKKPRVAPTAHQYNKKTPKRLHSRKTVEQSKIINAVFPPGASHTRQAVEDIGNIRNRNITPTGGTLGAKSRRVGRMGTAGAIGYGAVGLGMSALDYRARDKEIRKGLVDILRSYAPEDRMKALKDVGMGDSDIDQLMKLVGGN